MGGTGLSRGGARTIDAMFQKLYLGMSHGIPTDVVLGYINDGTDKVYASHARVEQNRRRTDVATPFNRPPLGTAYILGEVHERNHPWTYHLERPPNAFVPNDAEARLADAVAETMRAHFTEMLSRPTTLSVASCNWRVPRRWTPFHIWTLWPS